MTQARLSCSVRRAVGERSPVFSPSPLVGEGLGRGGKAEVLVFAPLPRNQNKKVVVYSFTA